MDPNLEEAARSGDVEFLRRAVASQPPDYFLTQNVCGENIFHLALSYKNVKFMRVALEILPITIQQKQLVLSQGDFYNWNPLHYATDSSSDSVVMVKLILGVYKPHSDPSIDKPWLSLTNGSNFTPLDLALNSGNEECAMEIMSMDFVLLCNMLEYKGSSPLLLAVQNGCNKVAEKILMSAFSDSSTPLIYAPNSSGNEEFALKMLTLDSTMCRKINKFGDTPLHLAIQKENQELASKMLSLDSTICRIKNISDNTPFHLAIEKGNEELSLKMLSLDSTLCRIENTSGNTPFHLAILIGNEELALKMLSLNSKICRIKNRNGNTPLHLAIEKGNEELALKILSLDSSICLIDNTSGDTPLHLAIKKGNEELSLKLLALESKIYQLKNKSGDTPLHLAIQKGNEELSLKMLSLDSTMCQIQNTSGNTPFHLAILIGYEKLALKLMSLNSKICRIKNRNGNTPLHLAIEKGNEELALKILSLDSTICRIGNTSSDTPLHLAIKKGNQELALKMLSLDSSICRIENTSGNTPLHLAIRKKYKALAMHLITTDSMACNIFDKHGQTPVLSAVRNGWGDVVEMILRAQDVHLNMLLEARTGFTLLHGLPNLPGRKLLDKYWWMIDFKDIHGETVHDTAKAADIQWLVDFLKNPNAIRNKSFDWIANCKTNEIWIVHAFFNNCKDLQKICRQLDDTPLDHIKFPYYKDYLNVLKNTSIAQILNVTNMEGATPLHRALERKDILLSQALLVQDGVERNKEDYNGRTAMSMLIKLSKENPDWEKMCKQINVNLYLKTNFIHPGSNLDQIRNTLSVVAALIVTITFAAGFTLPGGLSDHGNAILAKKVAFTVFLLADAFAMCTSVTVLLCLIWSMVPDRDVTYLLMDRSVYILKFSLYSTMLAFMTGIYTAIYRDSLWVAIIIIFMCCFPAIALSRTALHCLLAKVPWNIRDQRDQDHMLHEELALTTKEEEPQTASIIHDHYEGNPRQVQLTEKTPLLSTKDDDESYVIRRLEEGQASSFGKDNVKNLPSPSYKNKGKGILIA